MCYRKTWGTEEYSVFSQVLFWEDFRESVNTEMYSLHSELWEESTQDGSVYCINTDCHQKITILLKLGNSNFLYIFTNSKGKDYSKHFWELFWCITKRVSNLKIMRNVSTFWSYSVSNSEQSIKCIYTVSLSIFKRQILFSAWSTSYQQGRFTTEGGYSCLTFV